MAPPLIVFGDFIPIQTKQSQGTKPNEDSFSVCLQFHLIKNKTAQQMSSCCSLHQYEHFKNE